MKKMLVRIKDAADDRLRSFCGALTPEERLAAVLILGVLFASVNFYLIFRAIHDIGRDEASVEIIEISHIEAPALSSPESEGEMVKEMEEFFNRFNTDGDE